MNESAKDKKRFAFTLKPGEPVGAGLLRVVDALVQSVVDRDAAPTPGQGDAVHAIRITIKRLRAILRLVRPGIDETIFEQENARLRKAAHRLSLTRDRQVARKTLLALSLSNKPEQEAAAAVLAGLEAAMEPDTSDEQAIGRVTSDLEQTRRNLRRLRITQSDWNIIETGLRAVYRQGRRRMMIAFADGTDEAFHNWRIRVKNLYYELQLLEPVCKKRTERILSLLKEVQEKIGEDHDLVVLKSQLRKAPETFGGPDRAEYLIQVIDDKSSKLRRASKLLGKAIFAANAGRFVHRLGRHWKVAHKEIDFREEHQPELCAA
jgi:CHAD domain-containing protein